MILGLDIGSRQTKAVLLDGEFGPVAAGQQENKGRTLDAVRALFDQLLAGKEQNSLRMGVTGSGRDLIAWPGDVVRVSEIVALALGASRAHPRSKSVIEVGGQMSRCVWLGSFAGNGRGPDLLDFSLNEKCAAGAGAFLEQQALRLGLDQNEFSRTAASARRGAKVAGRCSVFAKSDMIHLQQKGTPLAEIAYGLCQALARNFEATVLKGKTLRPPVLLAGGGFLNSGLRRAFVEVLRLGEGDYAVADRPLHVCALGAALAAAQGQEVQLAGVRTAFSTGLASRPESSPRLAPLAVEERPTLNEPRLDPSLDFSGYLGVDVGSVSTNLVLLDEEGKLRAGVYLATRGQPLEAVKEGFSRLMAGHSGRFLLRSIGTTGSGRHLAGRFLRADIVRNEITCQLLSAVRYVPEVDSIFEIGGQDSKFISVSEGRIRDFTMNKICAAGTGSFLEEQAGLLRVSVEAQFAGLAARSQAPCELGSRCTVFMDTELAETAGRGASLPDLTAGLAYSIARNYLEKVVGQHPVGQTVVFQGGVAANAAVVGAFEKLLGRKVHVHPHHRLSGAIGAALLAIRESTGRGLTPRGRNDLEERLTRPYVVRSFQCRHCSNRCEVNRIVFEDEEVYFGDACERYTSRLKGWGGGKAEADSPEASEPRRDLFQEREELLQSYLRGEPAPVRIGIPRASALQEYLPWWATFFRSLGCEVVVSPPSSNEILEEGLKKLPVEACLPVKMGYGHAAWFKKVRPDWVILPSLVQFKADDGKVSYPCPYNKHLPFMIEAAVEQKYLRPILSYEDSPEKLMKGLEGLRLRLGKTSTELGRALEHAQTAQKEFRGKLRELGRVLLAQAEERGELVLAVLGKPYNVHDSFLNLNLSRHLAKLGVAVLPYDFIPLEEASALDGSELPVWHYNRLMLRAAEWCRARKNVYPVILTNFGCGPDSFTFKHLGRRLEGKPSLVLEFDEHRAEAGLVTRLEAFLDELESAPAAKSLNKKSGDQAAGRRTVLFDPGALRDKPFYLPYISDHVFAFSGAMKSVGLRAEVLPPPGAMTLSLAEEYSTGRECHAYSLLAGDLIHLAETKGKEGVFFFPGDKDSCLLSQFGSAMKALLRDLDHKNLEVLAMPLAEGDRLFGLQGLVTLWQGLVAADILIKRACRLRPYELRRGETDRVHRENLRDLESGLAGRSLADALRRCEARLRGIETRVEQRPLVGIAGDIYTRQNAVANNDLVHRLEELGCEVWPAPFFIEQIDFSFGKNIRSAFQSVHLPRLAGISALELRRQFARWKVERLLERPEKRFIEPGYGRLRELASPYFDGEAEAVVQLNLAKMADYANRGADGILNVICFNCMLGTVSAAVAERLRKEFGPLPLTTLVFSGSGQGSEQVRLEAFVYQVQRLAAKRRQQRPTLNAVA